NQRIFIKSKYIDGVVKKTYMGDEYYYTLSSDKFKSYFKNNNFFTNINDSSFIVEVNGILYLFNKYVRKEFHNYAEYNIIEYDLIRDVNSHKFNLDVDIKEIFTPLREIILKEENIKSKKIEPDSKILNQSLFQSFRYTYVKGYKSYIRYGNNRM